MLQQAFPMLEQQALLSVVPGLAIFMLVLAFNFVGDALRDVLDPRLRGVIHSVGINGVAIHRPHLLLLVVLV